MTGSPLNDKHVNLAQMLLQHQFPKLHEFYSTLLQHKESLKKVTVGVQIIHINYHWLTAAKFSPDEPLKVYDSVNLSVTNEIKYILNNVLNLVKLEWLQCKSKRKITSVGYMQ